MLSLILASSFVPSAYTVLVDAIVNAHSVGLRESNALYRTLHLSRHNSDMKL